METRRTLLRGATALALAAAIVGSTALAPHVSAATLSDLSDQPTSVAKKNKSAPVAEIDNDNVAVSGNDNEDDGGGIGDIPIIGDVAGQFENAEPEQIVTGVIEFAGAAAETIVPLIRGLAK